MISEIAVVKGSTCIVIRDPIAWARDFESNNTHSGYVLRNIFSMISEHMNYVYSMLTLAARQISMLNRNNYVGRVVIRTKAGSCDTYIAPCIDPVEDVALLVMKPCSVQVRSWFRSNSQDTIDAIVRKILATYANITASSQQLRIDTVPSLLQMFCDGVSVHDTAAPFDNTSWTFRYAPWINSPFYYVDKFSLTHRVMAKIVKLQPAPDSHVAYWPFVNSREGVRAYMSLHRPDSLGSSASLNVSHDFVTSSAALVAAMSNSVNKPPQLVEAAVGKYVKELVVFNGDNNIDPLEVPADMWELR